MANMIIDALQVREHIYFNDVVCNFDMTDNEFNELKNQCAKNIIIFVRQLKKINTIKQLIGHIEQQINIEHINQINNLQANFNIQVNNQLLPIAAAVDCIPIINQNRTYFTTQIYDTIVNSYNTSNDCWICPYQYNQLVINLQNIRDLIIVENNTLNLNIDTLRSSFSQYQKIKDYRLLLFQITTNL